LLVELPEWLLGLPLTVSTAAGRGAAALEVEGENARITVDEVEDIVTVILRSE
jgi:hypothetical protein